MKSFPFTSFFYLNVNEVSFVLKNRHILGKNVKYFDTFCIINSCQAIIIVILIDYGLLSIRYFTYNWKMNFDKKLHGLRIYSN